MFVFPFKNKSFKKMKADLADKAHLQSTDLHCNFIKNLVSVVLPVYNCEEYLDEAIISVMSQTYTDIELIIVDDGSSDSSGAIADKYAEADKRVQVIHQKNMKLPAALNTGFAAARGEFYTWTSADNRMLPLCIETLASELMRNRNYDMVYGNMRLIDKDGNTLKGKGWYEIPPFSGNVILPDSTANLNTYANNTIGAAFMYRAGAEKVLGGYDERFYTLEDYDYFMRMNYIFKISHILCRQPIYEYRFHKNSLTAHDSELGITSSRPALMDFDKERRIGFLKPLFYFADGSDASVEKALSRSARRIYSPKTLEKMLKKQAYHIAYINFENINPTVDLPHNIPKFLISQNPIADSFGYDNVICKNALTQNHPDNISIFDNFSLSSYIFLKAKSYFYQVF